MVQNWIDLVFLHWRYPVDTVAKLLPKGIEVETFDGDAWVGLIPFQMDDLGFPMMHPLPHVGSFPEVNVRTYVKCGEKSGVWFFSLDINKIIPTLTARTVYKIPYCYGKVSHTSVGNYVSTKAMRRWPTRDLQSNIVIEKQEKTDGNLERFLTARWGLIAQSPTKNFIWAPIDHPPWSLYKAKLHHLKDEFIEAAGLPKPVGEPHVMYSPGVPVRIGLPKKLSPSIYRDEIGLQAR